MENVTQEGVKRLFWTVPKAVKLSDTAKLHKFPIFGTVDQLPLWSIISNNGAASCQLAKQLGKLLLSLGKKQYTINSTKSFISFIKHQKLSNGHNMILFDILSLLTNVPPDTTIEFIIKPIYNNNGINTSIYKMEIKNYFAMHRGNIFDGKGYVQTNSVMMGSPLDPL